jgi:hypothetical protein
MDASAIVNLRNLYQARIDALTDPMAQARAALSLQTWEAAETQYQEILAASALSYSTSGRSVTKRTIESALAARNTARMELEGEIGGPDAGVTYADNGGRIW